MLLREAVIPLWSESANFVSLQPSATYVKKVSITLIGTGNTATVLGRCLKSAGHPIIQVFGREAAASSMLAEILQARAMAMDEPIDPHTDIVFLAVSDSAIPTVAGHFTFPAQSILVHTAASVSKDVLKGKANGFGVFYPLQSLKKEVQRMPEIPIIIDASDDETLERLHELAQTMTQRIFSANDEQRLKLHMAAVMVNNFTNHLYALVEAYCQKEGLDFSVLLPLIMETASRLQEISPGQAQTGPAIRNDMATIEKHLSLLQNHAHLSEMYTLFTESIQQSR